MGQKTDFAILHAGFNVSALLDSVQNHVYLSKRCFFSNFMPFLAILARTPVESTRDGCANQSYAERILAHLPRRMVTPILSRTRDARVKGAPHRLS
jgi:hypothetical protein